MAFPKIVPRDARFAEAFRALMHKLLKSRFGYLSSGTRPLPIHSPGAFEHTFPV